MTAEGSEPRASPSFNAYVVRGLRYLAFALVALLIGLGIGASVLLPLHQSIDPVGWVGERYTHVFISEGCGASEQVLEELATLGSAAVVVLIPVAIEPTDADIDRCLGVLETIRGAEDWPWWARLPNDYLCTRLFAESYRRITQTYEGRVPVLEGPDGRRLATTDALGSLEKTTVSLSNEGR